MNRCGDKPEPAFSEPWHAQVFAITVALNEAGHFEWSSWAARFGATLKAHGLAKELDGGEDTSTLGWKPWRASSRIPVWRSWVRFST